MIQTYLVLGAVFSITIPVCVVVRVISFVVLVVSVTRIVSVVWVREIFSEVSIVRIAVVTGCKQNIRNITTKDSFHFENKSVKQSLYIALQECNLKVVGYNLMYT